MAKGKKKDAKKKDAKKKEAPTDLQSDAVSAVEETQAIPEIQEEAEEPPVPVPPYHEKALLAQVIIKSYEGEQADGLCEGEGFACFEGGDTYKGTFSEGLMHGQGTYTWADGVKYEGTFVANVQMFNGRYTWNDGSVYEGSVKDGIRHGFGFFRSGTRPVSYLGEWCNGKRHGKGIMYFDEEYNSWYSGEWVNNVRAGWGMRRYRSGNTYEGQWEKNVRHGHGRMTWLTTNEEYIGQWVYGIQHGHGTHTWFLKRTPPSQYPLRNEYTGDFAEGERHGHGRFTYAGGGVYEGQWVCNKKHGKGIFVFKNGHFYKGEFLNDRLVKCAAPEVSAMNAKELSAIGPGSDFVTENTMITNGWENTSLLGSDIELDIASLLDLLPEKERQKELNKVESAVLRHMTELRRVYNFYSGLSCVHSPDHTFCLTKLEFWRFLKDCQVPQHSLTLADVDRLLRGRKSLLDIHCPQEILLFRTFLSYLVHLAFYIYHEEHKEKGPDLQKCFLEMMSRNVIPAACCVQGTLFCEERHTVFAMSYIDQCWEMYRAFRSPGLRAPFEPTMRMRQFVWMLDDFKLLSKELTVSRLAEIFVKVGACLHDSSSINMDLELVFLEFFEALLECASVYVTQDMIKEQVVNDNQKRTGFLVKDCSKGTSAVSLHSEYSPSQLLRSCEDREECPQTSLLETVLSLATTHGDGNEDLSLPSGAAEKGQGSCSAKEVTDEAKEDKTEQDEEFHLWMGQVQTFFTTKLLPAYQSEKVLREKVKEKKKQDAELAELRKIKDEELAKLIAQREAEEAKRQETAAAEKALASKSEVSEDHVPQGVSLAKGRAPRRARVAKREPQRRRLSSKTDAHGKEPSQKREAQKKSSLKEEAQKKSSLKEEAQKKSSLKEEAQKKSSLKTEEHKAAAAGTKVPADQKEKE